MKTALTVKSGCIFCLTNKILKGDVLANSEGAFLIDANSSPGNYLIVPITHAETVFELPDFWWEDVKRLLPQVPNLTSEYNLSFNIGKISGQTISHLHLWVIPRSSNQPASGRGLVGLIGKVNDNFPN